AACQAAVAALSLTCSWASSCLARSRSDFVSASAGPPARRPRTRASASALSIRRLGAVVGTSLGRTSAPLGRREAIKAPGWGASSPRVHRVPRVRRPGRPEGPRLPSLERRSGAGPHRLDEDVGHLGPAELDRRPLAGAQHLPDLGSGQDDPVLVPVWAGLGRAHCLTFPAVERVLEPKRGDPELAGLELVEDLLGVVRAVVAAHPGVAAPHDEVRAPVVLAGDRVPDRLLGARV